MYPYNPYYQWYMSQMMPQSNEGGGYYDPYASQRTGNMTNPNNNQNNNPNNFASLNTTNPNTGAMGNIMDINKNMMNIKNWTDDLPHPGGPGNQMMNVYQHWNDPSQKQINMTDLHYDRPHFPNWPFWMNGLHWM